MYSKYFKRLFDIVLSLCALIVLGIPMLIVAVCIRIDMGKPILFTQNRIGKDEKMFKLLKFRSMKNLFDPYGVPLPDDQRITKLGKFIRKTSLDELPSLINILKGDMSIVGPRPLPWNYRHWFKEDERKRHLVRGGLTGLAQVNGRNAVSWEKRFAYDVQYVETIRFLGDFKIILQTVALVLKRSNIGTRGVDTPPDFHVYRSGLSERELLKIEKENGKV